MSPRSFDRGDFARHGIVGTSATWNGVLDQVAAAAQLDTPVLITGERGVGKSLLAEAIHRNSRRKDYPLFTLSREAVPAHLDDTVLFGQRACANGCHPTVKGKLSEIDGGTLVLEEVGNLSPATQAHMVMLLATGEYRRLGDVETTRASVRIIAENGRDLQVEVAEGRFRADLFGHLSPHSISIPPIRMRGADLLELASHFCALASESMRLPALALSSDAVSAIAAHQWLGNARDLKAAIECAVVRAAKEGVSLIEPRHLGIGDAQAQR